MAIIVSVMWEDETPYGPSLPIENTTEVMSPKESVGKEEDRFKVGKKEESTAAASQEELTTEKEAAKEENISASEEATDTFTLIHTKVEGQQITLTDQKIVLQDNEKPIVMLNLFATWCTPCIGQLPYLKDLQKKYQKELLVTGILTHDNIDEQDLERFMAQQQINYFISNTKENDAFTMRLVDQLQLDKNFSIPLTVIYLNGEYFTHYEGAVPVEMIEYDIQQAKKQLKSR